MAKYVDDEFSLTPEEIEASAQRVLKRVREMEVNEPSTDYTMADTKIKTETKLPLGFRLNDSGLWYQVDSKTPSVKISGGFKVLAETRDTNSDSWSLLLEWKDCDDCNHQWIMPRNLLAGSPSTIIFRLLDGGLFVSPMNDHKNLLILFLSQVSSDNRARCVKVLGWHGNAYIAHNCVYGGTGIEQLIYQTATETNKFRVSGDLKEWKRDVAALAIGNSRIAFAIAAAFSCPLLYLIGEDSFGFHFAGGSSSGKTTALRVASSVWGSTLHTWRATDNAVEGMASEANDGLLLLDELSQADGAAASEIAYMLGNGRGKQRMRQDTSIKASSVWRIVFLSTGEIGLSEKVAESGKRATAGQSVRLIEIPADTGSMTAILLVASDKNDDLPRPWLSEGDVYAVNHTP